MKKINKINHKEIMNNILTDAEKKGWEVLKRWTADDGWLVGIDTEYVVLMKGNELINCQYHPFNKGLMKRQQCGGYAQWVAQ